mgnify:CR=1 FL=1
MEEFINIIFGNYSLVQLLAYAWFFIIGYVIYGLIETTGRDKNSIKTPRKWSWKFWFRDNWRRYLLTILCSYVFFRFYTELSGHPFGDFDAITLGLLGDGLGATIKKRIKGINGNREELTTQIKREQGEIG